MQKKQLAIFILSAVSLMSATIFSQSANAQVPPVLPTDVTGPTAGGAGPQGVLNNLGGGFYGAPLYGDAYSVEQSGQLIPGSRSMAQVLTYPALLPQGYQAGEQQLYTYPDDWMSVPDVSPVETY